MVASWGEAGAGAAMVLLVDRRLRLEARGEAGRRFLCGHFSFQAAKHTDSYVEEPFVLDSLI